MSYSLSRPTLELWRLRVGENSANHPNDCGPSYFQLKPRLAIRYQRFVSLAWWFAELLTLAELFFTQLCQTDRHKPKTYAAQRRHGAVVTGKVYLTFAQLCQQNQLQLTDRHDAFFSNNPTSLRHTFAPANCGEKHSANAGRKSVSGFSLLPSFLLG